MFVIRREPHNPILSPRRERPWEGIATFNPSVVRHDDGYRLFYRAFGTPHGFQTPAAGLSTIGMAFSEDGIHFHSRKQVIAPKEVWEVAGCEDPRVTFFEGKWYVFYTALGGFPFGPDNIKVAVGVSDDPTEFTERHLITPFNAKAATLFPERVNGDIVLLLTAHTDWTEAHPRPTIAIARAKEMTDFFDVGYWQRWHDDLQSHAIPDLRRTEHDHVEVGAAPVKTDQGWLLIYSHIINYYDEKSRIFSVEAAILDGDDPQKLVSRTESLLVPQEFYEEYGLVPHIVFPTSATVEDGRLDIWYGGADTVCAKASVKLPDLLRALDPETPARTFIRGKENPILAPQGDGFEARDVFNPAAIDIEGNVYILYRAMGADNTSTIGMAVSKDGISIDERLPEPVYVPRAEFELKKGKPDGNSGCEDPRIALIGDTLHLTYTAYDGVNPPAGAGSSISIDDFLARRWNKWSMPAILTPPNIDDKDLALLPEQVDGNYLLYHRINNQICADLLPGVGEGKRVSRCIEVMWPRLGMWDSEKIGVAAPPLKVPLHGKASQKSRSEDWGWLMIYHGVSRHATYRLGAALLASDGITVLSRTADPVFEPAAPYEKEGEIPNVVFSCGAVVRDDTIYLYYGAADKVVGVATASLSHMIDALT